VLRALIATLTSSARAIESATGLTNAQLFLLRLTAARDEVSINELAQLARIRQNGVSSVVKGLVRAGLLRSVRSRIDKRRASVTVTAKGKVALNRAGKPPTEALMAALDGLQPSDAAALSDGLDALAITLKLELESAPMLFERTPQPGPRSRKA
jgi:DNA-binding MarR family transcriptional regulator